MKYKVVDVYRPSKPRTDFVIRNNRRLEAHANEVINLYKKCIESLENENKSLKRLSVICDVLTKHKHSAIAKEIMLKIYEPIQSTNQWS